MIFKSRFTTATAWFDVAKIWGMRPRGTAWSAASASWAPLLWGITAILPSQTSHHKLHRTWSSSRSFLPLNRKAVIVTNCPQHELKWLQTLSLLGAQPTWEQAASEKWDQARLLWFSPGGVTATCRKTLFCRDQKPQLHSGCTKITMSCNILNSLGKTPLLTVMWVTPLLVLFYSNKSLSDNRQSRNFYQ